MKRVRIGMSPSDPHPDTPKTEKAQDGSKKPDVRVDHTPSPQDDSKQRIQKTENELKEAQAAEDLGIMKAKTGYEMVETISREDR